METVKIFGVTAKTYECLNTLKVMVTSLKQRFKKNMIFFPSKNVLFHIHSKMKLILFRIHSKIEVDFPSSPHCHPRLEYN